MVYKDPEKKKEYNKEYVRKNKEKLKDYHKNYRLKNKEKIKEANKDYREIHREKLIDYSKKYYEENKEEFIKKYGDNKWYYENPERAKQIRADYFQNNKEHIKKRRRERYANDLNYRMSIKLRSRFGLELRKYKNCKKYKKESVIDLIGCTISELIKYIESQFKPGMSWDNYGTDWHIDHIKPCSSFNLTLKEERLKCFHHTNLQPLWAVENLKKGSKYAPARLS